jgi:hypothetical protein
MKGPSSSRLRPVALGLLVCLVCGGTARADYKENYRKGIEAVDKGNWPEAARRMREAIAEQPQEGEKLKLYGMRFETYLPQYYLGLALFNSQDCAGASAAFQASETQGAVQKTSQYKTLKSDQADCQKRLAQAGPVRPSAPPAKPSAPAGPDPTVVAQAIQTAEADLAKADDADRALTTLESDAALSKALQQDAAWTGGHKQARETLAAARSRLAAAKGKNDLAQLGEARDLAVKAAQQLENLGRDAQHHRQVAAASATPGPGKPLPSATALPVKPVAPAAPPADLVSAARAYFSGRYQEAADALGRAPYTSGREGLHTLVLRAASRYALYVTGGEKDDRLRQQALADVQACRRLDPAFVPDAKAFSPRFTQLYSKTR